MKTSKQIKEGRECFRGSKADRKGVHYTVENVRKLDKFLIFEIIPGFLRV